MSMFRNSLMKVQDPFYFDFSKQQDNEIWYITFSNKKLECPTYYSNENDFLIGFNIDTRYPSFEIVPNDANNTYDNGIGVITYNTSRLITLGDNALNSNDIYIISFPQYFNKINYYSLNTFRNPILIFKNTDNITLSRFFTNPTVYINPNTRIYDYTPRNIIKRKL